MRERYEKNIENIADLTDEYIKKYFLDYEQYVKELKNIIVSYDRLEDYIKSILIKKLSCYSYYNVTDGNIYCDLNRQLKAFRKDTTDFYSNDSEREINGGKYLYLAQALIHECNHAKHIKRICSNKDDLETKILRTVYKDYLPSEKDGLNLQSPCLKSLFFDILDDILYNRYYEYAPEDRLADIDSYKKVLKVAKLLGLKCSYNYHLFMLYETYLDSYDQKEPPTIYYFMKTNRKEVAEELEQVSNLLDFDTRLKLGLVLTKKEIKKLESKQGKL